jgi:hypothetical protein
MLPSHPRRIVRTPSPRAASRVERKKESNIGIASNDSAMSDCTTGPLPAKSCGCVGACHCEFKEFNTNSNDVGKRSKQKIKAQAKKYAAISHWPVLVSCGKAIFSTSRASVTVTASAF